MVTKRWYSFYRHIRLWKAEYHHRLWFISYKIVVRLLNVMTHCCLLPLAWPPVKESEVKLQDDPSPPHTPHTSLTVPECSTPSQPNSWWETSSKCKRFRNKMFSKIMSKYGMISVMLCRLYLALSSQTSRCRAQWRRAAGVTASPIHKLGATAYYEVVTIWLAHVPALLITWFWYDNIWDTVLHIEQTESSL